MNDYSGIHHAAFATRDIAATVRYWRDLLGMPLIYSYGQPGYRQFFFKVADNCKVSFFEWTDVQKIPLKRHGEPVTGPFAFDHISIGVHSEEQLWDLVALLDAANFPVSDVVDHGCFLSVYSYDPNGIAVEFSWDPPGIDLPGHPVLLDDTVPASCQFSAPQADQWPTPSPILLEERIIVAGEGKENFP